MSLRFWPLTVVGLTFGTTLAIGQNQPSPEVSFKIEVNYVEVDARVTNREGGFIGDLKRDDFQVAEDGKPQKISAFGLVDVPFVPVEKALYAGPTALPIDPDVASNAQSLEGRLYLIVLDDYHIDPLRTNMATALARRFILERLDANDQAAVVVTSGRRDASQEFTQNRRLLLQALDHVTGQKLRAATLSKVDARIELELDQRSNNANDKPDPLTPQNSYTPDPDEIQRGFQATAAMRSLRSIAEWMSAIRGRRKAIIFISEGLDYDLNDAFVTGHPEVFEFRGANLMLGETWDTISAATRSNISIYAIDPRGLSTMGAEDIEMASMPQPGLHLGLESLNSELSASQTMLRQLAEATGGFAAVNSNEVQKAFDRIVEENSSYYVIGYYPTNDRRDGRKRSINVKIVGHPELQINYRKAYTAPRGDEKPTRTAAGAAPDPKADVTRELMKAMVNPLPLTGLTMSVAATPYKGDGKTARIPLLIELAGADLKFKEGGGTFNEDLQVVVAAFNKAGKIVPGTGEKETLRLRFKPDTHSRATKDGLRLLQPLSLPPGQYSLRVTAQDDVGGKQGSVHFDLEVPDLTKSAVALSSVALASSGDSSVTVGNDLFNGGLPQFPTALREFVAGDDLSAYVEVYDNQPMPFHRLDVVATVRANEGRVVFTDTQTRSSEELHGTAGGFGYTADIPLKGWAPGLYVLTIQAKSRLGNAEPISRDIPFRVR